VGGWRREAAKRLSSPSLPSAVSRRDGLVPLQPGGREAVPRAGGAGGDPAELPDAGLEPGAVVPVKPGQEQPSRRPDPDLGSCKCWRLEMAPAGLRGPGMGGKEESSPVGRWLHFAGLGALWASSPAPSGLWFYFVPPRFAFCFSSPSLSNS